MWSKNVVVFDLDDTLYYEIDFLKSAYLEISIKISEHTSVNATIINNQMLQLYYAKENVFKSVISKYNLPIKIDNLVDMYRNHKPVLLLAKEKKQLLDYLKRRNVVTGIITDGRSGQQRNKIEALKLDQYVSEIIISEEFGSEKPNLNNFKHFEKLFGKANYFYVGDNVKKDFVAPNKLGLTTICLKDRGLNVHNQNTEGLDKAYLAKFMISNFREIRHIVFGQN